MPMKLSYNLGTFFSNTYYTKEKAVDDPVDGTFITRGNAELLCQKKLAVFASNAVHNLNYLEIVQLFNSLKQQNIALAGGWHSFIEKVLFMTAEKRDSANYLYYVAKDLNNYRFNAQQQQLIEAKKLLMIGRDSTQKRISRNSSRWRNELIFSQMDAVLFIYIRPEGKLHACFERLLEIGMRVLVLDIPENKPFLVSGVAVVNRDNVGETVIF